MHMNLSTIVIFTILIIICLFGLFFEKELKKMPHLKKFGYFEPGQRRFNILLDFLYTILFIFSILFVYLNKLVSLLYRKHNVKEISMEDINNEFDINLINTKKTIAFFILVIVIIFAVIVLSSMFIL